MKCPESCKGCYREQTCELWKSTPLRQDIEAEGCDYYSNHAPTNFEKITTSPEALAEAMVFETMKGTWRFRIGEKISTQAFRSRWEAERGAVEYLKQEVENEQHS